MLKIRKTKGGIKGSKKRSKESGLRNGQGLTGEDLAE
jgi:hypothetical protein